MTRHFHPQNSGFFFFSWSIVMKELCICDQLISLFHQTMLRMHVVQYVVQLAGDGESGQEEMMEVFKEFETEFQILKDAFLKN